MPPEEIIIQQTKKWITDVVIGCNFCPFAAKEIKKGTVGFKVIANADSRLVLEHIAVSFLELDTNPNVETILIILPGRFPNFIAYLDLVDTVEALLKKEGREGIYQLASFHPAYMFAGTTESDASNYTNRSPHPIIQVLREVSITKAAKSFKDIKGIPGRNIAFADKAGLEYMVALRNACLLV